MIRKQWSFSLATALVFALFTASTASAGAILISPNATGSGSNVFDLVIGNQFTVGANPLSVTMLGVFDQGDNGLTTAHDAGIWGLTSTTPIVSATIPSGTGGTLTNNFRYVSVTPVILQANTTYRIGALFLSGSDLWHDNFSPSDTGAFTTGPEVFFSAPSGETSNRVAVSATLARPDLEGGAGATVDGRWAGANAIFEVVPEPNSFVMLLFGMIGLGLSARRKR
jgi:hypothetical protein